MKKTQLVRQDCWMITIAVFLHHALVMSSLTRSITYLNQMMMNPISQNHPPVIQRLVLSDQDCDSDCAEKQDSHHTVRQSSHRQSRQSSTVVDDSRHSTKFQSFHYLQGTGGAESIEEGKWKRVEKLHSCVLSSKMYGKMPRHLEQVHGHEIEVAKMLALPKGSADRSKAWSRIRNKGHFEHNYRGTRFWK